MASRSGISGNQEKSGNFEIRKGQGILMRNSEKSGNFTCAKRISPNKFLQNSFKW